MKKKLLALLTLFTFIGVGKSFGVSVLKVKNESDKNVIITVPGTGNVTYSPGTNNSSLTIPQYPNYLTVQPEVGIYKTIEQEEKGQPASQHRVYKIWTTTSWDILNSTTKTICNWDNDPGWTGKKTQVVGKENIAHGSSAYVKKIVIKIYANGVVIIRNPTKEGD